MRKTVISLQPDVFNTMKTVKVEGRNNEHRVLLYALSTCGWCRKTKKFSADNNVEYEYVDVDLCTDEEYERICKDILEEVEE